MQKIGKMLPLALLIVLTTACSSQESAPNITPANTAHWATAVDKEANLYNLDNKLFRSEQLLPKDYPLLKQHNVKTIINLRFFDRNDDKEAFGSTDLTLINTPLLSWSISPKEVAEVLWQIKQAQQKGAVLVHCYHGADRTGLISAMYRIIYQGWSAQEAKQEMIAGPYGFHSIWKNMENFFTEENIAEVREELKKQEIALK